MDETQEPRGDEPLPGDELQAILAQDPGYLEWFNSLEDSMSIMRCARCARPVDTDIDVELTLINGEYFCESCAEKEEHKDDDFNYKFGVE